MSSHGALWVRWKTLKLPWRKHFLVGQDLHGNTFWEFRPTLSLSLSAALPASQRFRRIVRPLSPTMPVSDLVISPQWHQWLRYTRPVAPTIQEQEAEVHRQEGMRILAREADERWRKEGSLLKKPDTRPKVQGWVGDAADGGGAGGEIARESEVEVEVEEKGPGRPSGSRAGEGWQPEAWTPKPAGKR